MAAEAPAPSPASEPARSLAALPAPDPTVDVVAIGASAGGVEALTTVVSTLPPDLDAAVLVVLHVSEAGTSVMPQILSRAGALPAQNARDGEQLVAGRIYVAPPGHHLTIDGSCTRIDQGPRENGHRPAIDPLLRSAGQTFGHRAAGVILSGARDDGTAGLLQLKQRGGLAIAQDPDSALYPSMPRSAIDHVEVDAILPLEEIAAAIVRVAGRHTHNPVGRRLSEPHAHGATHASNGQSSRFTCPDCGGVLWEFRDGTLERFRCSVGHAYTFESLVEEQSHQLESALWMAVRTLEDRALLLRRMERQSRDAGNGRSAEAFERRAVEAAERATTIRVAIARGAAEPPELVAEGPLTDTSSAVEPETITE